MEFEWCFEIGETVYGCFDDNAEMGLMEDDKFVVEGRDLDDEGDQFFQVRCERTKEFFDAHSSMLNRME